MKTALLFSCEHAGNTLPAPWNHRLEIPASVLKSHEGWDPGAKRLAEELSAHFGAPLYYTEVSRLLVECNRSIGHPKLFSRFGKKLSKGEKEQILQDYYHPYRDKVQQAIKHLSARAQRVLHISVHSFTAVLNGQTRSADLGLLYDPRRSAETALAKAWQRGLQAHFPTRRNYPYRGTADGFVPYLRRQFSAEHYIGLELEVKNDLLVDQRADLVAGAFCRTLESLLEGLA